MALLGPVGPPPGVSRGARESTNPGAQTLLHVIGVAQIARIGETEITLVSLEMYTDSFIANFRFQGSPPNPSQPGQPDRGHMLLFNAEAFDDLGNGYQGQPRGGGGNWQKWRLSAYFTPAHPMGARILKFTVPEVNWMARGPGLRSAIEPGPWEFQVEL